jgi:capsular exopolysaccharide synthesis family protein
MRKSMDYPNRSEQNADLVHSDPVRRDLVPLYRNHPQVVPPLPHAQEESNSDGLGVVEYWRLLKRKRGALVVASFLGLIAGVLFTLPQTPLYRSRTTVEIQNLNGDFMKSKQMNPVNDTSDPNVDVQTQIKIIQSESLVERVVDKMKTEGMLKPIPTPKTPFASVRRLLNLPTPAPASSVRTPSLMDLVVRQLPQTRMLEIMYSSPDPELASNFVNTLATEYIQSNMEARWKMTERTGQFLTAQLDEMRIKLEHSETELQNYAAQSGLLFTGNTTSNERANVSEDRLRQLQDELSKAQGERTAAQSRYEISLSAPPNALADVLNDASLRALQDKITDLSRQRADAIVIYTPKHEKVQRIEAQIAPLQAEFDRQRLAILGRIKNDYDTALRHEKLLSDDYAAQSQVVTDEAGKSIQYNILKRDVDSNRQMYESTLQQVKEASIASAMRASNIRIVDPAKASHVPYAPDMKGNAIVGLLGGMFLGVVFILIHERANRTVQQPGDMQLWTQVLELGAVPSAKTVRGKSGYGISLPGAAAELSAYGLRTAGSGGLMLSESPSSVVSEAFHTILTSILFVGERGAAPQVIVLTSGSPSEGKTTLVSNLAIAMADIRRKVLIIDADLRRPRIHDLFDLPNDEGLSTILRERSALTQEVLNAAIQPSHMPGLSILTSGPATTSSANLLYSDNMTELLDLARAEFDLVLIDTPPTLLLADARVLGRLADGVVVVTRANQTTRDAVVAVTKRFAEDGTHIIGTILNDWDPKKAPNGYYGYHNYSGYGYDYDYSRK